MHLSGWFERVSIRYIAVLGFQRRGSSFPRGGSDRFNPLYRGTWFPTANIVLDAIKENVSIRYIAVLGFQHSGDQTPWMKTLGFQSAISRYLVSNPTSKTPPLTSGGGNGLHTPRRIDHIPTFASLNHDKNTRSTHYTPNAGIELSETTPPPLPVNPVQKCA